MPRPLAHARSLRLDVLRGLAVVLVIGFHGLPPAHNTWVDVALQSWKRAGWIGVDLFFVLSGFLVAGLLFREAKQYGQVRVFRFLTRRGLKIYPAFYVFLAGYLALRAWGHTFPAWASVRNEALFIQNYTPGFCAHTWSLAVEEHFYLLTGVFVAWRVGRQGVRGLDCLPKLFLACAALLLGLRLLSVYTTSIFTCSPYYPTHLRFDSLLMGVTIAYYHHLRPEVLQRLAQHHWPLLAAGLLLLLPSLVWPQDHHVTLSLGFTSLYLGFGAILVATIHGQWHTPAWARFAARGPAFIGVYSYSIYLWHMACIPIATHLGWHSYQRSTYFVAGLGIYITVSVLAGFVAAKLVEMPVLALRDRVFPSRSQSTPLPAAGPAKDYRFADYAPRSDPKEDLRKAA